LCRAVFFCPFFPCSVDFDRLAFSWLIFFGLIFSASSLCSFRIHRKRAWMHTQWKRCGEGRETRCSFSRCVVGRVFGQIAKVNQRPGDVWSNPARAETPFLRGDCGTTEVVPFPSWPSRSCGWFRWLAQLTVPKKNHARRERSGRCNSSGACLTVNPRLNPDGFRFRVRNE
jgi:hypothetical protein